MIDDYDVALLDGWFFLLMIAGVGFCMWRMQADADRAHVRAWRAMIPTLTTADLHQLRDQLSPMTMDPREAAAIELVVDELNRRKGAKP
jgi:hypothetical protein